MLLPKPHIDDGDRRGRRPGARSRGAEGGAWKDGPEDGGREDGSRATAVPPHRPCSAAPISWLLSRGARGLSRCVLRSAACARSTGTPPPASHFSGPRPPCEHHLRPARATGTIGHRRFERTLRPCEHYLRPARATGCEIVRGRGAWGCGGEREVCSQHAVPRRERGERRVGGSAGAVHGARGESQVASGQRAAAAGCRGRSRRLSRRCSSSAIACARRCPGCSRPRR